MEDLKKIIETMKLIKYGFLDNDGDNIFDGENVENNFDKVYYLMPPEELLNKKVGVCWDQVELERKLFEEKDIKIETYFICIDDKENIPSHTFLVYYENDQVFWFENSWFDQRGIHKYNSLKELLSDVIKSFVKSRKEEVKSDCEVYVYKYNKPRYNITCKEFYDYIYTQQQVVKKNIKDL